MTARMTRATGAVADVRFVGEPGAQIFVACDIPVGPPRGLVVVAGSIQMEAMKNSRREVVLARHLADAGFACVRFQYLGTRNSDGDILDLTTESMTRDLLMALDYGLESFGTDNVAFLATRLGALALEPALGRFPQAPLILWDPASSGKRYFKELMRSVLMRYMKRQEGMTPDRLYEDFERRGYVDVHGFPVGWKLYADALDRTMGDGVAGDGRRIALMQLGRADSLRAEYRDLVSSWEAAGARVEVFPIPHVEAWWFSKDGYVGSERAALNESLIGNTTEVLTTWM